jgi:hypothetical protein
MLQYKRWLQAPFERWFLLRSLGVRLLLFSTSSPLSPETDSIQIRNFSQKKEIALQIRRTPLLPQLVSSTTMRFAVRLKLFT